MQADLERRSRWRLLRRLLDYHKLLLMNHDSIVRLERTCIRLEADLKSAPAYRLRTFVIVSIRITQVEVEQC